MSAKRKLSAKSSKQNYDRSILALKLKPVIAAKAKERQAEYHGNQYESGLNQTFGEVQNETSQESKLTAKVENWYFGNFALS